MHNTPEDSLVSFFAQFSTDLFGPESIFFGHLTLHADSKELVFSSALQQIVKAIRNNSPWSHMTLEGPYEAHKRCVSHEGLPDPPDRTGHAVCASKKHTGSVICCSELEGCTHSAEAIADHMLFYGLVVKLLALHAETCYMEIAV